jgi:hypothetical protein
MKKTISFSAIALLVVLMVSQAFAVVEDSYLQWPENGDYVSNAADVTVYSRVLKTGCTGQCDSTECADLVGTFYFRADSADAWTSLPMGLNIGDCYDPMDEYSADIPAAALINAYVQFYIEFDDGDGPAPFHEAPGSGETGTWDAANPAHFAVTGPVEEDFTLHICGDFHCPAPNGAGPGIAGSFNGWTYESMTVDPGNEDVYCIDVLVPAGSSSVIEFKFRNGEDWEDLEMWNTNREYIIPLGATEDDFFAYWSDVEVCICTEFELTGSQLVIFEVDLGYQDPATYAGGVSIQGDHAPLTWDAGATPMTDQGDGTFTLGVMFASGTPNSAGYKFTRWDGDSLNAWTWEDNVGNRLLCMEDNGFMVQEPNIWDDYVPPAGYVDVTFSVDMNCIDPLNYANGVSVQGAPTPIDWVPGSNMMSDVDEDGIYELMLTFPLDSTLTGEYKFTMLPDTAWAWEDNVLNRPFSLDIETPEVTLPTAIWDNWYCNFNLSISVNGNFVTLDWEAVDGAISYDIYASDVAYFVPAPENHLMTTSNLTETIAIAENFKYYRITFTMP